MDNDSRDKNKEIIKKYVLLTDKTL